eukprot:1117036-Prymnesium_polylepis.1
MPTHLLALARPCFRPTCPHAAPARRVVTRRSCLPVAASASDLTPHPPVALESAPNCSSMLECRIIVVHT